jgi:hypothetical protein
MSNMRDLSDSDSGSTVTILSKGRSKSTSIAKDGVKTPVKSGGSSMMPSAFESMPITRNQSINKIPSVHKTTPSGPEDQCKCCTM